MITKKERSDNLISKKHLKALHKLCSSITGGQAIFVSTQPEPWAEIGYCFRNMAEKSRLCGGKVQYGWQFAEEPVDESASYPAAVHHVVWRSPDGVLIDITPYPNPIPVMNNDCGIYFLPDDAATLVRPPGYHNGVARPSKYQPITKTKAVLREICHLQQEERRYWRGVEEATAACRDD